MIISTDNDNNYSLTIMLPGNGSDSRYETNVNVCPSENIYIHNEDEDEEEEMWTEHVSTMVVEPDVVSKPTEPAKNVNPEDFEMTSHQTKLLEGLNDLRITGHLLDVTLWAENRPFQAHRAVLASCSDYFRAMFTDPMRERGQTDIYLAGVEANGLQLLLDYVYTARLSLNLANIQCVLSAASHLQVLQVVAACSSYLRKQLDVDNCVDVATIAETYSLKKLRHQVYRFISERFLSVTPTQWQHLSADQIEYLLSGDFPVNAQEAMVLNVLLSWLDQDPRRIKDASRLLGRVDFAQIHPAQFEACMQELAQRKRLKSLSNLLLEHRTSTSIVNKDTQGLVNRRGMQMTLVKVGGFHSHVMTNSLSYYCQRSRMWHSLSEVPHVECSNFGCAVVNNRLYVTGGCFNQSSSLATLTEHVHPFGFSYNPRTDEWSTISPMNRERCRFTLTAVGQTLVAIGGFCSSHGDMDDMMGHLDGYEASAEIYDIAKDTWTLIEPMPEEGGRSQHAGAQAQDHWVVVTGGLDSDLEVLDSVLVLDTRSNEWSKRAPMPTPRADHVMVAVNKRHLLAVGGWHHGDTDDRRVLVDTIDLYDAQKDMWTVETKVPTPRYNSGVTLLNGKLYVVGGFHSDLLFHRATGLVECYDIKGKQWSCEKSYPEDIWEHVCVPLYIPRCREDEQVKPESANYQKS